MHTLPGWKTGHRQSFVHESRECRGGSCECECECPQGNTFRTAVLTSSGRLFRATRRRYRFDTSRRVDGEMLGVSMSMSMSRGLPEFQG